MGKYANSIHCVKKVLPTLDAMLNHLDVREYRINTETPENTKATAYDLREACSYLRKMDHAEYADKYLKYKIIATSYLFRERFDYIKVEKKASRKFTLDIRSDAPLGTVTKEHEVSSVTDLYSMIGFIASRKDIDRLVFPSVVLNADEILQLTNWCVKNNYKWFYLDSSGNAIHIAKLEQNKLEVSING